MEEIGQELERRETEVPPYPPRTFAELLKWNYYALNANPDAPLRKPITLFTNNFPIMVDARSKTLTWPAEPFSADHIELNKTAYFNSELVPNVAPTYKFYTPAFEQHASPKTQKYVLAVVEKGTGSYVVKFVNEATVEVATSTYTKIILEDYPPKAAEATVEVATSTCTNIILEDYPPKAAEATVEGATSTCTNIILEGVAETTPKKILASMHVIDKNSNKVYLSPSSTEKVVKTNSNPAPFGINFY